MGIPSNMSIAEAINVRLSTKTGRPVNVEDWLHEYADGIEDKDAQKTLHRIAIAIAGWRELAYRGADGNGYAGP